MNSVQNWWKHTASNLRIRRGQSGRGLVRLVGDSSGSPYKLRLGLERMFKALCRWAELSDLPEWAEKLAGQLKQRLEVLRLVPPSPEELDSE